MFEGLLLKSINTFDSNSLNHTFSRECAANTKTQEQLSNSKAIIFESLTLQNSSSSSRKGVRKSEGMIRSNVLNSAKDPQGRRMRAWSSTGKGKITIMVFLGRQV